MACLSMERNVKFTVSIHRGKNLLLTGHTYTRSVTVTMNQPKEVHPYLVDYSAKH